MNWSSILCDLNAARFVEARYLSIVLATDAASCLFLCHRQTSRKSTALQKAKAKASCPLSMFVSRSATT